MRRASLLLALLTGIVGCDRRSTPDEPAVTLTPLGSGISIPESHLNRDWQTRDRILGISVRWGEDDLYGTFRVDRIELSTLKQLLSGNFIDPAEQQNEAPTVAEFDEFMRKHSGSYAFGYAVSPTRPDYRVSLEGIAIPGHVVTPAVREAARALCHDADETAFEAEIYCWWD
jgi:hypothetical protein